jgi:hypothetical protein
VDAVAYVGIVALASTGLVLRFQLPPGSGGLLGIGSGSGEGAGSRPVSVVWGLSRHEWGSVHYWIAVALLGVLAVHLVLHWKWIVCVLKGKPRRDVSGGRFALGIAGLVLATLLAAAPLLTPAATAPRSEILQGSADNQPPDGENARSSAASGETESIRGYMTLEEVARNSGVSVSEILERLDLPRDTAPSEQVGRLLRAHGLPMSTLRQALMQESAR